MAVELIEVFNKKTGDKTLMSEATLEWATDFERTPQQKAEDRKSAVSGTTKEK